MSTATKTKKILSLGGILILLRKRKFLLLAIFIILLLALSSSTIKTLVEVLTPPTAPDLQTQSSNGEWLPQHWTNQNWGNGVNTVSADTQKYHHISQGTQTLPVPYDWFLALEEPNASVFSMIFKSLFFRSNEAFSRDEYLLKFGFIRSLADPIYNPDGLPIGFAKSASLNIPGYPSKTETIGFSCAACHTGHFVYGEGKEEKEYIIEGAPATTDLGQLTATIAATLGQTALSSKIPFFDGRFDRFAKKVLGTQYSAVTKAKLATDLASVVGEAAKTADVINVQEGFGRLDALNRIGNQVFAKSVNLPENYQAIEAPVNFPHLWTTSWFDWVQYDASIMQPLVRNAGEAMGVNAHVSMSSPEAENRYDSSIPMEKLLWLEQFLKGNEFNTGLTAPAWVLPQTEAQKAQALKGKALYKERCESCHLPTLDDPALKANHFSPIDYKHYGQNADTQVSESKSSVKSPAPIAVASIAPQAPTAPIAPQAPYAVAVTPAVPSASSVQVNTVKQANDTPESVLKLKIIPQAQVGTDPAQGDVLVNRTINTAGNGDGTIIERKKGLGIDTTICGRNTNQAYNGDETVELVNNVHVKDGGQISFGLALGALVQQTIDAWFEQNGITDPVLQEKFRGGRPNCIQAGLGYKARPLNGVWATAPFLHNGSVATLKDLLCPTDGVRPAYIKLGGLEFDPVNVGLKQEANFVSEARKYRQQNELYTKEGYFILDTSISGNSNSGHMFSKAYNTEKPYNQQQSGVIGTEFSEEQCRNIIEYIKTL
jgi:hypothetical protein